MLPKIVLHNSVSLDGSFIGLTPDMCLHYQIVGHYKPEMYLAGSNTAKSGIEMYGDRIPAERESDLVKPVKDANLSYWVIPDTKGALKGLLHVFRQFEFCRDVIVLVSEVTPVDYLEYLTERQYEFITAGREVVDYRYAFSVLSQRYFVKTILVDTGSKLGNILLNENLVDEISLLISPEIVGEKGKNLFAEVKDRVDLNSKNFEKYDNGYFWVAYQLNKVNRQQ